MTKKNKIYIAIIVGCVVITIGIMMWGSSGSSGSPTVTPVVNTTTSTSSTSNPSTSLHADPILGNTDYPPPAVFPADTNFDTSVLNSGEFTRLKDYVPVTVTPEELGAGGVF